MMDNAINAPQNPEPESKPFPLRKPLWVNTGRTSINLDEVAAVTTTNAGTGQLNLIFIMKNGIEHNAGYNTIDAINKLRRKVQEVINENYGILYLAE